MEDGSQQVPVKSTPLSNISVEEELTLFNTFTMYCTGCLGVMTTGSFTNIES